MVGFYATEEEAAAMMQEAHSNGKTLADWLRSLIPPKADDTTKSPRKLKREAKGKK